MIALVGLGDWGSRHVTTLLDLVGRDGLVGVDVSPERRAAAEALGVRTVATTDRLPATTRAAVVATPTPTHAEVAAGLLERGLHLLVEKPLARTVAEARELVELADRHRRVLMVGHVFLFQRAHRRLRAALAELGSVRLLAVERRTPGLVKPESGAWDELAPHELAVALDLGALRGPVRLTTFLPWSATGIGRQDGALARLASDGGTVEISCSWLSAVRSRRVWAVTDGGQALLVDDGPTQRLAVWPGRPDWIRDRPPPPVWEDVSGPPPLRRELQAFLRAIRHHGRSAPASGVAAPAGRVPSDGVLGLRVVELLSRVTQLEVL